MAAARELDCVVNARGGGEDANTSFRRLIVKNFGWRRRTSGTVRTATMAAALGLAATSVTISAAPRAEKQAEAKGLVEEALHAETFGDQSRRGELLRQAGTLAPNLDEPHWHAGEVKIANKWVKIEDMPNVIADDLRLTGYERKRADAHDTVADQLALADWCRDHKLYEQERAHLTKLLTLAPDHAPSRSRLGFLRVNGSWDLRGGRPEGRCRSSCRERLNRDLWFRFAASGCRPVGRQQTSAVIAARKNWFRSPTRR